MTCRIDFCLRPAYCRGWCRRHYERWLRHDDPLYVGPPKSPKPRPKPAPWAGRDLGVHRTAPKGGRCGGRLTGLVVDGHEWAVCDRCGLRGYIVEQAA